MPFYLFTDGVNIKEVFFHMNDEKRYSENGVEWERIYTIPNTSIDISINPLDSKSFVAKTANKRYKFKDLQEKSKELSLQREKKMGKDPVKEKWYKDYSDKRNGAKHPDILRQNAKNKLAKLGVIVAES